MLDTKVVERWGIIPIIYKKEEGGENAVQHNLSGKG